MSITPYLRPDLDQTAEQLPLYITGTLDSGKPGDAYEGRLQIHNQAGACVVLSVTGDDLPVGGTVSIDGDEVVVAWPAYAEAAAPITNPGFEDGMAGWQGGAGWSTTTDNPIAGTRSAVFKDAPGSSILSSLSRYPVDAGDTIHASAAIRQGASSAGNAGAGVRMEFRDAAGALVGHKDGNMVMSASNNAVKPSTVTVTPGDRPAGTELVNIACHGLRKRQNREVWADTFAWDHAVAAAGINADATICITIQIRDSAGRTASWSGCVSVSASKTVLAIGYVGSDFRLSLSGDGATFGGNISPTPSFSASEIEVTPTGRAIANTSEYMRYSDDYENWTTVSVSGGLYPSGNHGFVQAGGAVLYPFGVSAVGIVRSVDNGVTWSSVGSGTAWSMLGARPGLVVAVSDGSKPALSFDDGVSFGPLGSYICGADSFELTAASSASDGSRIIFAGRAWQDSFAYVPAVAHSADGVNWTLSKCSTTVGGSASSVCVGMRGAVKVVLVGCDDGRIYQSKDNMMSWSQVNTFGAGNVVRRIVDNGESFIAVGGGGTIRRSADGDSGTWSDSTHGLTFSVVNIVALP